MVVSRMPDFVGPVSLPHASAVCVAFSSAQHGVGRLPGVCPGRCINLLPCDRQTFCLTVLVFVLVTLSTQIIPSLDLAFSMCPDMKR